MTLRAEFVRLAACAILAAFALPPQPAAAQASENRPIRRLEAAGGGGWIAGSSLGVSDADLRANRIEPQPYPLFTTDTRFESGAGIEARLGFALSRRYTLEGTFSFGRPELRTSVSGDVEGAPDLDVVEKVDQYLVDGGVIVMLDEIALGSLVPFAGGGIGYVRHVHEGQSLVESGRYFFAAAGVRHWFFARPRGLLKSAGARVDVRLAGFDGGITVDDGVRRQGTLSGSVFVVF